MAQKTSSEQINLPEKSPSYKLLLPFGAVSLWALWFGYYQVFSYFPPYDDEGYLMMTVKQFVGGKILYEEIYTQYGAVFYFYKWLIHGLPNLPVTHNINRLTTLLMWILTALLGGIFAFRLTRSALAGAAAYVLTFLILFRTAYEPGHPQELCGLLLICALLLSSGKNFGGKLEIRVLLLGVIIALLFLTKINLGIFLAAAAAIAFTAMSKKNRFQRFALIGLVLLTALMPFVLFRDFLAFGWLRLSILVAAALVSMLFTSLLPNRKTIFFLKHYLIAASSFFLTTLTVFLVVHLHGASAQAFLQGVFFQHLEFGGNFFQNAPVLPFAHFWGIFALTAALAVLFFRKIFPAETARSVSVLKLIYGFCIISASFFGYRFFLNVVILISFATPFLWLVLLNRSVRKEDEQTVFPRIFLAAAAILQPLQIFPIAGTQMNFGAFLMLIVAVVCVRDALDELTFAPLKIPGQLKLQNAFAVLTIVSVAVYSVYRLYDARHLYYAQTPLEFSGADRLRLPQKDAAAYNFLVENLKKNCDSFITMPGIYSLNFWTEIEPPTTFNATAWMTLLDDERQRTIIEKMKTYPRNCVVYNPQLVQNALRGKSLEQIPLADFVLKTYTETARTENYRVLINRR